MVQRFSRRRLRRELPVSLHGLPHYGPPASSEYGTSAPTVVRIGRPLDEPGAPPHIPQVRTRGTDILRVPPRNVEFRSTLWA